MAIQLDKILADIAKEKALHPNNPGSTKQEQDEAWARIGRLNKLTVHESRSIFIVLQKKYEQEKLKGNSGWKLFGLMQKIHQEHKAAPKNRRVKPLPMEEVEVYEMLEVQEPEDDEDCSPRATPPRYGQPSNSTGSASSDGDSPIKSNSTGGTPEKDEHKSYAKPIVDTPRPAFEEKKLLNTMASNPQRSSATNSSSQSSAVSAAAAALQKKGITLKKTPSSSVSGAGQKSTGAQQQPSNKVSAGGRTTIQLPEAVKRKLSDECASSTVHKKVMKTNSSIKQAVGNSNSSANPEPATAGGATASVVHTTTAQLLQVKKERESNQSPPPGINIITIPAAQQLNGNMIGGGTGGGANSSTGATVASTSVASTNGFSPHIEELEFKNEIIFDSGKGNATNATPEIINLGNFDNSLPPTFFKNLCNSGRHEALGLYVANVMNRISRRAAAKLELGILRAIVDVQSDELEQ
ncbi:uncharacterized protein LOC133843335 [Drosophila sulfurigaster albostrigata]|uniref:uncharacterized protein LOC133843335 n=1 Tax=Drosophila sulfurigaster albostrigata TaxID=89887 RepID=UPI002D21AAE0|nr:uncharacterized protein LOC133843335 [Drosophila sulfurigaster albostrigata]